jgi:hypothetical protein
LEHFRRTYCSPVQVIHRSRAKLAMDLLRLMKDLPGGLFPPDVLISQICSFFPPEYEDALTDSVSAAIIYLQKNNLVYSDPDSTYPDDLILTPTAQLKKLCTSEDSLVTKTRHLSNAVAALRNKLIELQSQLDPKEFCGGLLEWRDRAAQIISLYAGPKRCAPLSRYQPMCSRQDSLILFFDDLEQLQHILTDIHREYSCAPPHQFAPPKSKQEFDKRLVSVALRWDRFTYQGRPVSAPSISAWINQFESDERSFMLRLVEKFEPISHSSARSRMGFMNWTIAQKLNKKRPYLLISAFGHPGKSGSGYARMFAQERWADVETCTFDEISDYLESSKFDALVFFDDVIGSGDNAEELLGRLSEKYDVVLTQTKIKVIICSMFASVVGLQKARILAQKANFAVDIEALFKVEKCFESDCGVFDSKDDYAKAKDIALKKGLGLRSKHPLGHKGGQMLLAFPDNCPDNTLPIFNAIPSESSELKDWIPLFPRHE